MKRKNLITISVLYLSLIVFVSLSFFRMKIRRNFKYGKLTVEMLREVFTIKSRGHYGSCKIK